MRSELVPLTHGEPVGVVALSGPVDPERLEEGLVELRRWGHPVVVAPNIGSVHGFLAGTDDERIAGLESVLDHGARVILAARGGYGAIRILPKLPWSRLVRERAVVVGFSDVTAILGPLADRSGVVQVHGPMVAAGLGNRSNADRLHELLEGRLQGRRLFNVRESGIVRAGRVRGRAAGGNLALLASLVGTPWQPNLDGAIVFLEDVNEPGYRLDRMLTQLVLSGMFRRVKALISGGLQDCRSAGAETRSWREMLLEAAPDGAPVVVDLPFGHGSDNHAFPIGAIVTIDTDRGRVDWSG